MAQESRKIVHQGLAYDWSEEAFLSRKEAKYALARLWERCAGTSQWEGEPVIEIPAVESKAVRRMFALPPGELPSIRLSEVSPQNTDLNLDTSHLPALCADSCSSYFNSSSTKFPIDIVAASFLLLSRWEEAAISSCPDEWGNYQASSSLAARQNFLERPIIDEWSLVLRAWLSAKRPRWQPPQVTASVAMTHDIDHPVKFYSWSRVSRAAAKELIRGMNLKASCRALLQGTRCRFEPALDPYLQGIERLLQFDEELGVPGMFFYMAADAGRFDEGYNIKSPLVRGQIQQILSRGHEVGWHPSYRAAESDEAFVKEKQRIDDAIQLPARCARHHYLRWRVNSSWSRLAQAGVGIDSSLGYNETVGFRCGTSHPFPVWDLATSQQLNLIEQPLVVQEGALFYFMNLDPSESADRINRIWRRVRRVGGCMTVLVHNSQVNGIDKALEIFRAGLS